MKKIMICLSMCFWAKTFISQNNFAFSYDNGGNMIQRQLQVLPQRPGLNTSNPFSSAEEKDSSNVVEFKVYPNPTKDVLNIEGSLPDGIENATLLLFNSAGQALKTDNYSGTIKQINVSNLKAGLYYLEVKYSKKRSSNYKIIITN